MYADLWLKRVLVPAWVAQIILNGVYVGFAAYALSLLQRVTYKEFNRTAYDGGFNNSDVTQDEFNNIVKYSYITLGIFIGIAAFGILFSAVEIFQFARKRLSPVLMVVLNAIGSLIWMIVLGLNAWATYREFSVGFIWPLLLSCVFDAKLIYSAIILHRVRKGRAGARGSYAAPAEMGVAYNGSTAYNAGAKHANTEYYSPDNVGYSGRA